MAKYRSLATAALLALFLVSSISIPLAPMSTVAQSSCDSAHTFHVTLYPTPDTLNAMTSAARASFQIEQLEQNSAFPLPFPNGSSDWAGAFISQFTSTPNYSIWYYHVRPGLTWSDGRVANATDVLDTYGPNFALNPAFDFAGLHTEVKSEYAANASTAVYVLNISDALFPEKTSFMYFTPIYPSQITSTQGGSAQMFDAPGVGPFVEQGYTPGTFQLVMVRNPYYSPQPAICQIDFNFVDNIGLTATYLAAGSTDLAPVAPANVAPLLASNPNLRVFSGHNLIYGGLQWNVTTYPFNMTEFRQALAYGINQSTIASQAFAGYAQTAYNAEGTIPSANTAWYNPNQMQYSYNVTKAKQLLASIGITSVNGHMQYPNGTQVTLNLWTDVDQTWDTIAGGIVQANLQALNFTVNEYIQTATSISAGFHSNQNNMAHDGMILYSTPGVFMSSPFLMTLPGWDTTWLPSFPPNNLQWEAPLSINTQYYGNLTAFDSTANTTQQAVYVNNIQALNAQYLPILTLGYDSYIWVGNLAHWQGWPSSNGYVMMQGSYWNRSALVSLTPVAGTTTTTSTSASGTTPTSATTTTSSSGTDNTTLYLVAGIIVVIVVVGLVAAMTMRRRKPVA
jgi:peptide/nickel transport system substrate-binding protein